MLSTTFRYALISLLEIADAEDGVNSTAIAQRHDIPVTYLANVLRDLRRLGLISSQKGRRGGYLLAKPAEEINLLSVHQGLAGSGSFSMAVRAEAHGAELWLQRLELRWRRDLETTTVKDVQRYIARHSLLG